MNYLFQTGNPQTIERLKEFITTKKIRVVIGYPREQSTLPAYVIMLAPEQEQPSGLGENWEAYGVDFVKEGTEWKIWHLHMFTDIMGSFFITLGGNSGGGASGGGQAPGQDAAAGGSADGESPEGEAPEGEAPAEAPQEAAPVSNEQQTWEGEEGAQIAKAEANDYLSSVQYKEFSSSRLRKDMELFIPTPYDSWSFDDENFGPTREELESYNIDLDAWYAAHSK